MDRLRDWISNPKANGYEALHTTVMSHTGQWVEIQIRSKRMDEIAEKGYAAHWKYKEFTHINSRVDNWLDRIREMIESPDDDALSFMDDVKGYFFLDEISVFTPQGELRTLPANSTILDFAYAIHTEVGNTCIGAKVDKKLVPITHLLKNGEQIEIITSKKQTPKEEWIHYVVTTRAKSNIKIALKKEKRKYFRHGKEKLEKWFSQNNLSFTHENIKNFLLSTAYPTLEDLYFAASHDKIGLKEVKQYVAVNEKSGWLKIINLIPSRKSHNDSVKDDKKEPVSFLTGIKITGIDKPGLINDIARIISRDMNLNIKSFHLDTHDGLTDGEIMLFLQDRVILKKLLNNLTHIEGIKTAKLIT
jgi:GTP pyrophosphokinase